MWHRCSLNFICHKMFGGVGGARSEDWQVLTSINRQKRLLASIMPAAAERHDGIASALHIATDTMRPPGMFSIPCCGRANAQRTPIAAEEEDILAKIFFSRPAVPAVRQKSLSRLPRPVPMVTSVAGTAQSGFLTAD
jgi:hypothetical protein